MFKSSKSFSNKFDFNFSDFRAIKVPKGWDKLFISLVSIETGKTISKLGKASVRNGTCRWTETLSESMFIPQDDSNSNDLEFCLFKFVVAMGSSRSGVLGEVEFNIGNYTDYDSPTPLSFPLKKCNYSTSLQFKVQCLTRKTNPRDVQNKVTDSRVDYESSDQDDMERNSDASDGTLSRSAVSNSSKQQAVFSRDSSLSDSHRSFDSVEVSSGHESFPPQNSPGATILNGTLDSSYYDSRPNHSNLNSRDPNSSSLNENRNVPNPGAYTSSSFSNTGSSKDLVEAAEMKIEELGAEARMWERNAKKLMGDVDVLKEELSKQSKSQETLKMELSASLQESDGLKQEIKYLKRLVEESSEKQDRGEPDLHARDKDAMQQEMKNEIEFLKESNADLTEQLQKTQESNVELLTILQELEGIVESQKVEIESLRDSEKLSPGKDADEFGNTTEIDNIKLQLQQLQETQEELEGAIKFLEKSVEEKDNEIINLKTKPSECGNPECGEEMNVLRSQLEELHEELRNQEVLLEEAATFAQSQVQCQELEGKCSELELELQSFKQKNCELGDEIEALRKQLPMLQNQIANLGDENRRLEESVESLEREKTTSDGRLEELKKEIAMLQGNVDSHASANKVLERLSSELGKGKYDLEQQLSDSEKENMQLSDRVSALEVQLRYLTNEKETCNLELRHSESQVANLRDGIRRIEIETEAHKNDMRQKLQDMRDRWLKAQEECEYLKLANPRLQATTENLITECSSLQKLNEELKRHNIHLHTRCSMQESQLRESHAKISECLKNIDALEVEFSAMVEEVSVKERSLKSELDSLVTENREHQQKLVEENLSLNNMYSQKVVELEKLQRELVHFIEQISESHDKQDSVGSDTLLEVSTLRANKAKLEASVQELQANFTYLESKLSKLEIEHEDNLQELTASRQNYQLLMAEHDKLLSALESLKTNEEKQKTVINETEMKLKASDYQRLQLGKEISSLKEQLQGEAQLQNEVLALKTSLNEAKFECEKTRDSLDVVGSDHKELKTERDHLVLKVSNMDKALSDLEACQRSKAALEERVVRLEGDLAAREALWAQDSELKIELSRLKRVNGELQRKVKHLEKDQKVTTSESLQEQNPRVENSDSLSKIQALEYELAEALEANEMYKAQLRRYCDRNGSTISAFEKELRDLQEKYFQITLKYAEVEAQREELVSKLKMKNNRRGWFS